MCTPVCAFLASRRNISYEVMHHTLARSSESSSRWCPHAAGGHSHNAPATTDVMSGANRSAATTTSWPAHLAHNAVVRPTTPAPITRTLSCPPGLTLATDGAITGTPTATGTFDFTLAVTDADGLTATSDQAITVAPGCSSPTPTPSQAPSSAAPSSAAPAEGGQLPDTAVDGRQPTTGADLTVLAASAALLAAGVVLAAVAGRRRPHRF